MTDAKAKPSMATAPAADRVLCPDSLDRLLLDAGACGTCPPGGDHLDQASVPGGGGELAHPLRRDELGDTAGVEAIPAEAASRIDADAVGRWIISRYPAATYPAVVLGSAHGGAVHLAAALGAPWLPTGFTITVRWPGGSVGDWGGARDSGATVAAGLLDRDPTLSVRQVHDPVGRGGLCASTVSLHIRWRRLPPAYRTFLQNRLQPGGASLLLRDLRTWPVLNGGTGHTFQFGSPISGWQPDDYTMDNPRFAEELIRRFGEDDGAFIPYPTAPPRYAESAGEPELEPDLRQAAAESRRPTHRVLYPNPEALSACVADLHRDWLRERGGGQRCVVETERALAPGHVLAAGLVPYWCESASRRAVAGAEWWLAGSSRFASVDVLPAPPAWACDAHAEPRQWDAVAWFGRYRGQLNPEAARRYPQLPTRHAATALDASRPTPRALPRVGMVQLLNGLRGTGQRLGIMVP